MGAAEEAPLLLNDGDGPKGVAPPPPRRAPFWLVALALVAVQTAFGGYAVVVKLVRPPPLKPYNPTPTPRSPRRALG